MSISKYVCPCVHPSRKFFRFQWNLVCRQRSMTDARRYATRSDPRSRSRSRGFWSSENCTFPSLSTPPFTMRAGKWPLILKLGMLIELDEWCTMVCHVTRSKVKVKVTSAWKPLKTSRPSVPHGTNFVIIFSLLTYVYYINSSEM